MGIDIAEFRRQRLGKGSKEDDRIARAFMGEGHVYRFDFDEPEWSQWLVFIQPTEGKFKPIAYEFKMYCSVFLNITDRIYATEDEAVKAALKGIESVLERTQSP